MEAWRQCFGGGVLKVIGMIHVPALPGTPKNNKKIGDIIKIVSSEVSQYIRGGVDAIMVENMHDVPYQQSNEMGPDTISFMTRICSFVRQHTPLSIPCGVQVLASGNKEALAVAVASEFQFIRCEGFVYSHIADEGWTDSCAANLLRYRKQLDAEDILILCDIKKKHSSHAITADVSIGETAAAAEMFLADGVIVTGLGTGHAANPSDLALVRESSKLPLLVGSGITPDNVHKFINADGLIVGSFFKENGRWDGELDEERVTQIMTAVKTIREKNTVPVEVRSP